MKNMFAALLLVASFVLTVQFTGCKKHSDGLADAVITEDLTMCACCGGLMLTVGDDPQPYTTGTFRINSLPSGFIVDSSTKFPIYVRAQWTTSAKNSCNFSYIDVTKIELR